MDRPAVERPIRGVERFIVQPDKVDIVKILPLYPTAVEVTNAIGRNICNLHLQHIVGCLQCADEMEWRRQHRAETFPVEPNPRALAYLSQINLVMVALAGRGIELDCITSCAGEATGVRVG